MKEKYPLAVVMTRKTLPLRWLPHYQTKCAKTNDGGSVPRKVRKVIAKSDDNDDVDKDDALLAKMGELLKGVDGLDDPLVFD